MGFSSPRVKFCQIPYTNFETTSWFLSKFCISLQFYERLFLCTSLAQTIYTLLKRSTMKMKFFEIFQCSGQILSNSLCQFWNDKSTPLQILYLSSVLWKIAPIYFFSSKNIYFAQNEPIKMNISEIFEPSSQNLWNSLCQFETSSRFLSKFCISVHLYERLFLCTFLAQKYIICSKRAH